ncbi:MAG: hypothetical protein ACLU0O_11025 [Collinsella sp.]
MFILSKSYWPIALSSIKTRMKQYNFLGTEFDKPAYDFVEAEPVNAIMATGEDSLAARKPQKDRASAEVDIICGTLGTNQLGQEDLFHHLSSYCTKLAKRDNNTNISRRLIIAGSWASVQQTTILNSKKPTLIYADPGAGKSELLKYYAGTCKRLAQS